MTDLQAHLERLAHQPADAAALSAVEATYSGEGRWEELLRVYEDNALRADNAAAAVLLRKAATISLNELASAPRAEAYLQRAITAQPTDVEALRALREIYLARGDYEHGVELYERELARTTDAQEKAQGLLRLAQIYVESLGRAEKALSVLKQAQRVAKDKPEAYRLAATIYEAQGRVDQALPALLSELEVGGAEGDILERIVIATERLIERPKLHDLVRKALTAVLERKPGHSAAEQVERELDDFRTNWQQRVTMLEQRAHEVGLTDKAQAAEIWLSVAEVQLVYGERRDAALVSIDKALAGKPGHPMALRLLEEIYGAEERWDDLALKLEMMAGYTRDPNIAVELYLKAALHYSVRLDDPEASSRIYLRVLQLDPGNKVASNAVVEFYRERKQWNEALSVLAAWAERATTATDKVAAHYASCRIHEEELGDKAKARPHYEAILALDPENQAAARALEEVYRAAGDHAALAKALRAKLAGLTGEARVSVLAELGDLYGGPLQDNELALEMLGEVYQHKPDAALRERLEELAAMAGAFASLVQILEGGLDRIATERERIDALHSLAALYEGARDAPLEALRIHRRILALDANDERARQALDRLLQAVAETTDKIAFYREQVQAAGSDAERISILRKLAKELVDTAKDYVRAIDTLREILRVDPDDREATEGLLALYRRDNRWAEVADTLARKLERTGAGADRTATQLELAKILEQHLGQFERAADWYCDVLREVPENDDAIAGLERLIGRTKQVARIAELLQPRYVERGAWDKAAGMIEVRVKEASEPEMRAELLRSASAIYEQRLGRPAEALGALLRAFQTDPNDAGLQVDLERLAQQVGDYSGVLRAYRATSSISEGGERRRLLQRAAGLAERAGDVVGATVDYLRVLGLVDGEGASTLEALERLLEAGLDRGKLKELVRQVADGLEPDGQAAYWRALAKFFEQQLSSATDAIGAWREVLNLDDSDEQAQAELDRLIDSSADASELVGHLRAKLEKASDDAMRISLGLQIAETLAKRMSDTDGAIAELVRVTEIAPGQRQVWQELASMYQSAGRLAEAGEAMQREINLLPEGEDRRVRLVAYAELNGKQLGDIDVALGALQSVLAQEPAHEGAITLLEALSVASAPVPETKEQVDRMLQAAYGASNRWADAVALLSARADAAAEPAQRVALLKEVAALRVNRLNDAAAAYADLERAFGEAPLDAELRMELERLAELAGAWPRLVDAYDAAWPAILEPEQQKPIRRKLAQALDKLGRGAEAIEHYRAVSGGTLPDDLPSLEAMERLLRAEGRLPELAEVIDAVLPRLPADAAARRKALLNELAQLCEQQLADKPRAVENYRHLVELDGKDLGSLRRLEALLLELSQPAERAEALQRLIELGTANPELVNDTLKLGDVMRELGNADEALKQYRAVLLKKRDHTGAVEGLEALIAGSPNKVEIAQVLEPIYTAKQDHAKLAWILEARLEGTTELTQRKGLLRRIGDIYENRLQQKENAFIMARRSLAEDPADMGVRMWIEKLAGETGALAELAGAYVEEAQKAEAQLKLQFHRRAAAIYHEKLSDGPSAVGQYQAILELEPRDEKALTGLEAILRSTEAHAELVDLLRRRLAMTAGLERKREYLNEIADLQATKLVDLGAAVETYRQILEVTPEDAAALGQIEALLGQMARWEELAAFYEAEIKRLAEKRGRDVTVRRLELTFRRARLIDEQFGDREQAAQIFDAILAEDGNHALTIGYLETRTQSGAIEAMALLEKVYRSQGKWQQYVDLLERKLAQTLEPAERRDVLVEIARTYDEHLRVGDMAFLALTRAYNENRADTDLLDRLTALAEKNGNWEELVEVVGSDVDALPDAKLRQDLLHRLGDICGNKLNDVDGATVYLQQALQYDPRDEQAMSQLDGLLEKEGKWAALADLLERRIELADDPKLKSQLLERLAVVWGEQLHDAEAALRCHKQILDIDPDHPLTLKAMEKLYRELQDWDSLARNLLRQAEVLTERDEQIRIHASAGELFAEELGDMAASIEHWQKVVELDPTQEEGNQALIVLLTTEERWEDLASLYQRQLQHTQDPTEKADINRRLGVILGEKLGRSEDALGSWLEVLGTDPKNLDALRALLGLYSERAMWEEFVDIARRLIPLTDPAEAKEVRFSLAKALGENLGKREEAIKLAREVRATEPHTAEGLARLAEMLTNIEAWDEAVIALEKSAALESDDERKVQRYNDAAHMHRDRLGKPNDARAAYESIREVQPQDVDAYTALAQIYRDTGEWRKLVVLNEDFVPHAEPAMRLEILTEIRDVQDEKLGEKELAFIAACRVYKENPQDLGAAEVLERIGIETEGAEELAAVLEDEVDNIVDTTVKIASYRRIARIYAEHLKEIASAEAALQKILALDPADLEALDAQAELGAREERFDKQVTALEQKLQHVQEDMQRKSILFDIARIWEDRIGDVDQAIAALNRVLEIDGVDVNALDALARIYAQESRWSELAHTLTRKVELEQDPKANIDLRLRVASLCEGELNDAEAAIEWFRGVLDFDGGNATALASLERLYTGMERWSELVQVFEVQIAQASDNEEKIRILSKEASIYESEFDSARDSAACYERVLQIDSTHMPSIRNLERLLRQLGEWNRLIEVLQHHITLISDNEEITGLYLQIGEIYYRELSRVDKAEEIYNTARNFNPASEAALHVLGQLYERSGNWFQSLEMLQREADALGGDPKAMPVFMRIGRINEEMLLDMSAAKAAYERALAIDPNYGPALQALKEIAKSGEDWDSYAEHLIAEAEAADDREEKTDLFYEAANFFQKIREDEASAVRFYQRALELTPEHLESAKALADIYFRNEQWQKAGELYRIVVEQIDKARDPKEYCQKNYRLGYIAEKLGEREQALVFFRQAFEADASYLPALEGLGQALLASERWEEAQKVFQSILIHHRESLTESEVVDITWQLGDICLKQRQPDRAYKQFEKALEIDPDHGPSLKELAQLDQQMENWHGAYERLSRLGDIATGPERGEVLMRLSEIARDHLSDAGRSVEALERARRSGQAPLEVLERLAKQYLDALQAPKAVEVLEQAIQAAKDPQKISDLNFELATVLEKEIKHEPMAVQRYNAALDANPTNVKAFEAIERVLGTRKEWGLLEENYRAMIARAKDLTPQVRLVLWRNLAELYRRVLKSVDHAIMAYEVIRKLDPGKPQDVLILADLYAEKPEHRGKAIDMQHELLPTLENPVAPIKKLRQLYHATQQFDAVYALASSLVCLNEADEEERKIFAYLQQGVPQMATQSLTEDHWPLLLHADVMNPIGQLAATLYRAAPDFVTEPAKELGLKKKDFIDVRTHELYLATRMRYVGKLLGVQGVDLYRKSGSMEPLQIINSQPPALAAGEANEIFRETDQRMLLFHVGRNMAYARPELFLARVHPGDELRDLLYGLCLVYNRSLAHNGNAREVERWATKFERLPAPALKRLQAPARDAYAALGQPKALQQYLAAVEISAGRAGLIAAGDLAAAIRGTTKGGDGASNMPVKLRIKELVLFAVSKPYLQLRQASGSALVVGARASAG